MTFMNHKMVLPFTEHEIYNDDKSTPTRASDRSRGNDIGWMRVGYIRKH